MAGKCYQTVGDLASHAIVAVGTRLLGNRSRLSGSSRTRCGAQRLEQRCSIAAAPMTFCLRQALQNCVPVVATKDRRGTAAMQHNHAWRHAVAGCWRWLGLLVTVVLIAPTCADDLNLAGSWRVQAGDDPTWATTAFDDSHWPHIVTPTPLGWLAKQAGPSDQVFWLRRSFDLDEQAYFEAPAIYLGMVQGGVTVWVNGVYVGESGNINWDEVVWRANSGKAWPRIVGFAPTVVSYETSNTIAIRLTRAPTFDAGILAGPIGLRDRSSALAAAFDANVRVVVMAVVLHLLDVAIFFSLLAAIMMGFSHRSLVALALSGLVFAIGSIANSPVLWIIEMPLPAWVQVISLKIAGLALPLFAEFAVLMFGRRPSRTLRAAQALSLVAVLIPPTNSGLDAIASLVFLIAISTLASLMIWWSVQAMRGSEAIRWLLVVGVGVFASTLMFEIVLGNTWMLTTFGHTATDVALKVLIFAMIIAGCVNYVATRNALDAARTRSLTAEEDERRRLSREIHDGLGQFLSSIKLGLQIAHRGNAPIDGVVQQVDEAIFEARRISHDLSPLMIEQRGLLAAMRSHAETLAHAAVEIEITTTGDGQDLDKLAPARQGHIYRIFQEAITNAIKHGAASRIDVHLGTTEQAVTMSIADDGSGPVRSADQQSGLGIASMRERATLLGGRFTISYTPSTVVTISVPLGDD